MIRSRSNKGLPKLKQLFLSKDSFLLGDEELYQIIKNDFHEKQTYKALRLVKPYLHISFSGEKKRSENSYNQMLKETSDINIKKRKSFSHFRIYEKNSKNNLYLSDKKEKLPTKIKNNIPLPNKKLNGNGSFNKIKLKSINFDEKENSKNNNLINTEVNNNYFYNKKWQNRSLSTNNFTIESPKKNNKKNIFNQLNQKISLNKLLSLRSRFFSNEKMNRGELTEMMFGNKIPFYKHKSICDDMQKKVYEVLSNNPKLIIDLIEKGYVEKKDVIDYFNIKSINISWNDNLEKIFREISYNKRKTNSNMLKTTFFLVNIGFHKILKQKFEEKNFKTINTYNQFEIEEFSLIYEKLKKYDLNTLLDGYSKVDGIYHLREVIINDKINKIRNNYYHNRLKKFFHDKNKTDIIVQKVIEKEKKEMKEVKNFTFQIRENKGWKYFPYKNINKLRFTKPITKINKLIKEDINIKNICLTDNIKKKKNYIKEIIKLYQKEGILPSISSNKYSFNWKTFMNENKEKKRIIEYCIIMIQSRFRGFMVKIFLSKIISSIDIIINAIERYIGFKKLILKLYRTTFNEILMDKFGHLEYKNKVIIIRKIIKVIIKNCKNRKLLFNKNEIDLINRLEEMNIGFRPIRLEQEIYSIKLLLSLDKFLFYLYNEYR